MCHSFLLTVFKGGVNPSPNKDYFADLYTLTS